ncbi:MAG: hypothetical protein JO043_06145 [Candidatus Eremiobacteraeota bacterium]|nr:hypothetical protein [Candidatus Eremiobacteraeota bacterium]
MPSGTAQEYAGVEISRPYWQDAHRARAQISPWPEQVAPVFHRASPKKKTFMNNEGIRAKNARVRFYDLRSHRRNAAQSVRVKVVSEILGHSSIAVTLESDAHVAGIYEGFLSRRSDSNR